MRRVSAIHNVDCYGIDNREDLIYSHVIDGCDIIVSLSAARRDSHVVRTTEKFKVIRFSHL